MTTALVNILTKDCVVCGCDVEDARSGPAVLEACGKCRPQWNLDCFAQAKARQAAFLQERAEQLAPLLCIEFDRDTDSSDEAWLYTRAHDRERWIAVAKLAIELEAKRLNELQT